jgi:hypothetical protein
MKMYKLKNEQSITNYWVIFSSLLFKIYAIKIIKDAFGRVKTTHIKITFQPL